MGKTYYCTEKDAKNLVGEPYKDGNGFHFNPDVCSAVVVSREEGREFIQKNETGGWPKDKGWSDFISGMDIEQGRVVVQ